MSSGRNSTSWTVHQKISGRYLPKRFDHPHSTRHHHLHLQTCKFPPLGRYPNSYKHAERKAAHRLHNASHMKKSPSQETPSTCFYAQKDLTLHSKKSSPFLSACHLVSFPSHGSGLWHPNFGLSC